MSLDLSNTAVQVDGMASHIRERQSAHDLSIENALRVLVDFPVDELATRILQHPESAWGVPRLLGQPSARTIPPKPPHDFTVVAADGSHIAPDRHLPVHCFLINTGIATLRYGSQPDAWLRNNPTLYMTDDEVMVRDKLTGRQHAIEGAVLGAKRAVSEIGALAEAIQELPDDVPVFGLLDGSLVMPGLVDHGLPDFVITNLIRDGLVGTLDELQAMASKRTLAVGSYISLPGSFEVVNALRLIACSYNDLDSRYRCSNLWPGTQPCNDCVGGVLDREIFARLLESGERSALFATSSPVTEKYYMDHGVYFCYVNTGEEIGRLEVPSWVAEDDALLDFAHALLVDQCHRGQGYPVSLMEAHEQAVVGGSDRRYFCALIEEALQGQGLPVYTSEKERSKRLRWL